jgi:hypothetical protein
MYEVCLYLRTEIDQFQEKKVQEKKGVIAAFIKNLRRGLYTAK